MAAGLLVPGSSVQAKELLVPEEFPTIAQAIDEGDSGDTVLVSAGSYTGTGNKNIYFRGKELVLLSRMGPEETIIDCEAQGGGFRFVSGEGNGTIVEGFRITQGRGAGSGVVALRSAPIIRNCIFDNGYGDGGAIFCDEAAAPVFEDCLIKENRSENPGFGGGVFARGSSSLTFRNCVFSGNFADGTGGGLLIAASHVEMSDCVITGNAAGHSGALGFSVSTAVLERCTISNNEAVIGPALWCGNESSVELRRTIVWDNCPYPRDGPEIVVDDDGSQLTLACCALDPNELGEGGIIELVGQQVRDDPLFFSPQPCSFSPTTEGDYRLFGNSPCLPDRSPCGELIGARDVAPGSVFDGPFDFLDIHPNPLLGDVVRLSFTLPRQGLAELRLLGVTGRIVGMLLSEDLGAGEHHIGFDLRRETSLSSGVYYLSLRFDGRERTRHIVVLK